MPKLEKLVKKFCKSENVLHATLNSGIVYTCGRIIDRIFNQTSGFSLGEPYIDHLCVGVGLGTYFYKKFNGCKGILMASGAITIFNLGWESYEYFTGWKESGLDKFLDIATTYSGLAVAVGFEKVKGFFKVYEN